MATPPQQRKISSARASARSVSARSVLLAVVAAIAFAASSSAVAQAPFSFKTTAMTDTDMAEKVTDCVQQINSQTPGTSVVVSRTVDGQVWLSGTFQGTNIGSIPLFVHSSAAGGSTEEAQAVWSAIQAGQLVDAAITIRKGRMGMPTGRTLGVLLHELIHIWIALTYPDFATDPACADCAEQFAHAKASVDLCAAANNCQNPPATADLRKEMKDEANEQNKSCMTYSGKIPPPCDGCEASDKPEIPPCPGDCTLVNC